MAPGAQPESRRGKRQVKTAEHEVRDTEVDDEHGGSVANLRTNGKTESDLHWRRRFPNSAE